MLPLETQDTQKNEKRKLGFIIFIICNNLVCEATYA